jgi:hypothetical protein
LKYSNSTDYNSTYNKIGSDFSLPSRGEHMARGEEGETYSIPLTLKIRTGREPAPPTTQMSGNQGTLHAQLPLPPFEWQAKTMQVTIGSNLHEYLRIHAALTRQSLRDVAEKAVRAYIEKLEEAK